MARFWDMGLLSTRAEIAAIGSMRAALTAGISDAALAITTTAATALMKLMHPGHCRTPHEACITNATAADSRAKREDSLSSRFLPSAVN